MDTIKNKTEKWRIDEPKRVYVVQSSHGQYEDHITEINGIYSRPDVAESEAQKIRDYYKELTDKPEPFTSQEECDNFSKEDYAIWLEWMDATDYNRTWVTEFELDK